MLLLRRVEYGLKQAIRYNFHMQFRYVADYVCERYEYESDPKEVSVTLTTRKDYICLT
jgi:hypothetical protein